MMINIATSESFQVNTLVAMFSRTTSDSEDDEDYVPHAEDRDGSDSVSSQDGPENKRARLDNLLNASADGDHNTQRRRTREALWKDFQESATAPASSSKTVSNKMIDIQKTFIFAGEEITEVVAVPENSADAKKWPLAVINQSDLPSIMKRPDVAEGPSKPGPSVTPSSTRTTLNSISRKPGPRKPKTDLNIMPSTSKAKNISTLEKSAMDWKAYVDKGDGQNIKNELDANRRGGGYLEKMEFLHRVDDAKAKKLEESKPGKRRR